MANLITQIGSVLTAAIGWVGDVVSAMFGAQGALADLLPYLALGMGIGILGLGVKYVRSFVKIG
jgi:hypothetical protein